MKKTLILILCLISVSTFSQSIKISKSEFAPKLDGNISPSEYSAIDSITSFRQLEPAVGKLASQQTKVFITYTDKSIFVGVICYDKNPNLISSGVQTRDQLKNSDDSFFLILDSYNDKRSGFGFGLNSINTQTDFKVSDDGRNIDYNWDTEWKSFADQKKYGWVAEFEIPFGSITFNTDINDWGLVFRRVIKQNVEVSYWPIAPTYEYQISKAGILSGLMFPEESSIFSVIPYSTFRFENTKASNNVDKFNSDFGIDARINLTPGLVGNLTINPDFATVEGDQEQINLTRYELSFPEKRLFFMEGNDLYSTRIKTFYSRRIGDIDAGAKLSGKIKDYTISVVGARSPKQNSTADSADYFSAVRIKKDILKSSSIGVTFADKSSPGSFARSLSLDYLLNLNDTWKLTGQLVGSAPGDLSKNLGWFMRFANESNVHHIHLRITDLGDNFKQNVNQTGFVVDDDRREMDGDLSYKWWFENTIFKNIEIESKNNIFWSHAGTLRGYHYNQQISILFKNKISFEVEKNYRYRLYEKGFHNYSYQVQLGYNTDEWSMAELSYEFGKNFDSNLKHVEFTGRVYPVDKLAFEYTFEHLNLKPDPEQENTNLHIVSANYNFNPNLWIKMFAQSNLSDNRIYLYGLLGWRFKPPFSALYLIYTFDRYREDSLLDRTNNRILFLKFSYQIDF